MIPARSFFLIRHGETVMNAQRLTCGGGVDTELNHEGRRQASVAAKVLVEMDPAARPTLIVHSGMKRTTETAAILNDALDLPVVIDRDLREHMMGEWERKSWDEVFPFLHGDTKPEGGESRHEFGARIRETLTRHLNDHAGHRIMFVGHGGTFHSFQLIHGRARNIFIPNATLHRFDPEPTLQPMPWKVTWYEWKNAVREGPAPFCPSQGDEIAEADFPKASGSVK